MRNQTLRFLSALLGILATWAPALGQETPCPPPPNCDKLKIEAVRVYENVSTTCTSSGVLCGDRFTQMFFKIYARIETPLGSAPFNLDYQTLDVSVKLKKLNAPIQYSYINVQATDNCFKTSPNGSKWFGFNDPDGNKVIWEPREDEVSISFANLAQGSPNCGVTAPGGLTGNQITFSYDQPDCTAPCGTLISSCAYVELFTVVVNAYPGEYVALELGQLLYVPKSDPSANCSPIGVVNTVSNVNCYALASSIPIATLPSYASTPNADIEAKFLPPVADGNGGYTVDIQVKNNSTSQSFALHYLEFLSKTTIFQLDKPFEYVGAKPREIDGGLVSPLNPNERVLYLHYQVNAGGQVLGPGGTWTLGTIKMGPPPLTNQAWNVFLEFKDSETRSRLKTGAPACTTLKTSGTSEVDVPGTVLCSNIGITFRVEALAGNCSGTPATAKVGLHSEVPGPWKIRQVKFNVTFDLDPGVSISNVTFPDWPTLDCDPYGCVQTPDVCWEVSPDGKTLSYCFLTTNADVVEFDLDPEAYMLVEFSNSGDGCVKGATTTLVEIRYLQFNNEVQVCIPPVEPLVGFPQCGPAVTGRIATEANNGLEDATVQLKYTCTSATCSGTCNTVTTSTTQTGTFGFCTVCGNCDMFDVVPEKDNDPLNGVSTFDLVLMNKHILGLEPLNSPYKIIAADANKSNSITTFDIVGLRKLILGIFTNFSQIKSDQTSWRFIDADLVFTNPINPFIDLPFPESINCVAPPASGLDFVAVKVGDVNGNAMTSSRPGERPVLPVSLGAVGARSRGGIFTVPVIYTGDKKIEAFQMGLRFDPAKVELLGPSMGDLPGYTADHFGLTRRAEGEIKTLWLSPTGDEFDRIGAGTVLFYLSFRALTDLPESEPLLVLDNNVLDNAAWEGDLSEYALAPDPNAEHRDETAANAPAQGFRAGVRPNPSSGEVVFSVHEPPAGPGRIALFDAFGKLIFMRRVEFAAGSQDIAAPEVAGLPLGVYVWKVIVAGQKVAGHLVKQ